MKETLSFILLIMCILLPRLCHAQNNTSASQHLKNAIELINQNREEEALLDLNECLHQQPDNDDALFMRARIYSNMRAWLEALTDYNKLIELDSENKEAYYGAGVLRYQLEQYEAALEDFHKCLRLPSKETNTAYFKISPTQKKATGISTINQMNSDIWNFIGMCYYELGEYRQSVEAYNEGIKEASTTNELIINRALAYQKQGEIKAARNDFKRVLAQDPENEIAAFQLLQLQNNEEKLESLNSFIEIHSDLPGGYTERGLLYYSMEQYDQAKSDFIKALEFEPENIIYQFNLALVEIKLQQFLEAENLLINITEEDTRHSGAYFNLGNIKYQQNGFRSAISYYTLAIEYEANNPSYYFNRSLAYYNLNEVEKACADIKILRRLDSEMGRAFERKHCQGAH